MYRDLASAKDKELELGVHHRSSAPSQTCSIHVQKTFNSLSAVNVLNVKKMLQRGML